MEQGDESLVMSLHGLVLELGSLSVDTAWQERLRTDLQYRATDLRDRLSSPAINPTPTDRMEAQRLIYRIETFLGDPTTEP